MPVRSDPADQLLRLCRRLKEYKSADPVADALAAQVGVETYSPEYHLIIGAVAWRFGRLEEFVDQYISGEPKQVGIRSLRRLQRFMIVPRKGTTWDQARDDLFPEADLNTLSMLSAIASDKAPLLIPTEDERRQAIEKIDEALTLIKNERDIFRDTLYASLQVTKRMLERFEFWGSESLCEQIEKTVGLFSIAKNDTKSTLSWFSLNAISIALNFAISLNLGLDIHLTALENNYNRMTKFLEYTVSTDILLLPSRGDFPSSPVDRPSVAILPQITDRRQRKEAIGLPDNSKLPK